jgi:acetyl-CoA C-acetyltransferase
VAIRTVLVGLADVSRIDPAALVAAAALKGRSVDPRSIGQWVLGVAIPQRNSFDAAPWLAACLQMPQVSGRRGSRAFATAVDCIAAAAAQAEAGGAEASLIVTSDRTSNGPGWSIRAARAWAGAHPAGRTDGRTDVAARRSARHV